MEIKKGIKYRINGKEYSSVEEMPETLRRLFEDKNQNGVPDILEGTGIEVIKRVIQAGSAEDLLNAPPVVQQSPGQRQADSGVVKPIPRPLQFEGPTTFQRIFFFILVIAAVSYVLMTVVFRPGP